MVSMTWAHYKVIHAYWSTNLNYFFFFPSLGFFFIEILSGIFQIISELFLVHSFFAYISLTSAYKHRIVLILNRF